MLRLSEDNMNIESIKISMKACYSFCKDRISKLSDKKIVKVAAFLFALFAAAWVAYSVGRWIIKKLPSKDQNKLNIPDKAMEGVENSAKDKGDLTISNEDAVKKTPKDGCQEELIRKNEEVPKGVQESLPQGQEVKTSSEEKLKAADEDINQEGFPEGESGGVELKEEEFNHDKFKRWKPTFTNEDYSDQFEEDLPDDQVDGQVGPTSDPSEPHDVDNKGLNVQGELAHDDEKKVVEQLIEDSPHNGQLTYENGDVYEGQLENGQPHGQGQLTCKKSHYKLYVGEFKEGMPHGQGEMTYKNGEIHTGQFKDGKPEGEGKLVGRGNLYVFKFEDGQPVGKGTLTYQNGDVYEGELEDFEPHGRGETTYKNGVIYKGEFENGLRHGQGELIYHLEGEYHNYKGEFKEGKKHGEGKLIYKNENVYQGQFVNGKCHGYGEMFAKNGCVYKGAFEDGKPIYGSLTYKNGNVYVGEFQNKKPHGQGKLTKADGQVLKKGEFQDGKFIEN